MGYDVEYRGVIHCDPALDAQERRWLHDWERTRHHVEGDVNAVRSDLPGYWCPWEPTRSGHLTLPEEVRCHSPGEWLRWLVDSSTAQRPGPDGSGLHPRRMTGVVQARGRAPGDEWRLVVDLDPARAARSAEPVADRGRTDGDRLVVERDQLPCPPCWIGVREMVEPSAAYRFAHPEAVGNADIEAVDDAAHTELLNRYADRCAVESWRPVVSTVEVVWPPPAGSPPHLPPFQMALQSLLDGAGLGGFTASARLT